MELPFWRSRLTACASALALGVSLSPGPAIAAGFDFFGLFGSEAPPPPSADALPYALDIAIVGEDKDLRQAVRDSSTLYRLRQEAPPDADALVRRAEADLPHIVDALWGAGYYNARVAIDVAGTPLRIGLDRADAAVAAARVYKARALAPVRIVVDPGPVFRLRDLRIVDASTGAPLGPAVLPQRIVALAPGDRAQTADILAAQARIVDHFRAASRPFAKVTRVDPVVDHPSAAVDLTLAVDPGVVAPLGEIAVKSPPGVDPAVVRSFIYAEPGDPYSPKALTSIRRSVAQIEALSSVRIRAPAEPSGLDAQGRIPLLVEVTERPPRALGLSARYSTRDGPGVGGSWTHRNLFGGAERLRLQANALYLTDSGPSTARGGNVLDDIGGRVSASFLKPALGGTRNDLLLDATGLRERTEGYVSSSVSASAAIRHRFAERFSAQAGVMAERGRARDVLGEIDYTLVGLPVSATWDTTDRPLDPTRGFRLSGSVTPFPGFLGSTVDMTRAQASAAGYYAVDEAARLVLAGRVQVGSIFGASLLDIPANQRFFAGGGGSVRGFAYKSLGPQALGEPIGGRSLLEGSLEARWKITETIGLVPFVDAGTAFESSLPDFNENIRVAAGLGLRYYTSLGPIRLDVAMPVSRRKGEAPVAFYIGFGQAF